MRLFILTFISVLLSGCGGSENNDTPDTGSAPPPSSSVIIDPTLLTMDTPPIDGQLPNELKPPL